MSRKIVLVCIFQLLMAGCHLNNVIGHYTLYDYKVASKKAGDVLFGSRLLGTDIEEGENLTTGAPYRFIISIRIQEDILSGSCAVSFKDISLTNQETGGVIQLDPLSAERKTWLAIPARNKIQKWLLKPAKIHAMRLDFTGLEIPYGNYFLRYGYTLTEGCGVSPLNGQVELLNETDFQDFDITVWWRFVRLT